MDYVTDAFAGAADPVIGRGLVTRKNAKQKLFRSPCLPAVVTQQAE